MLPIAWSSLAVVFSVCVWFSRLQEVDDLYRRALDHFNDEPILHVFAAQYYNIFRNNHRIEQMHLTEAEVRVAADVRVSFSKRAPYVL